MMSPVGSRLDDRQRALVIACTAPAAEFPAAADRALAGLRIDGIEPVNAELLPLVYRRLERAEIDHPLRRRLRYFYLQSWRHTQTLIHHARPVLDELERRGSPYVVLKGGAIVSSRYRDDLGVRPMGDLDVLIDPAVALTLLDSMLADGWRVDDTLGWTPSQYLAAHHAVSMLRDGGGAIDVHVGLLSTDRSPQLDQRLVARAVPTTLAERDVLVLDTTSQVMHTLSHSNPNGVRHLVDALYLLDVFGGDVDWDELCVEVIDRRSLARTLETIQRVVELRPDAVPRPVIDRLTGARRHWSDWSYQGVPMASRYGARVFASRWAQRSRGAGPWGRIRIAGLLARHYAYAARAARRPTP